MKDHKQVIFIGWNDTLNTSDWGRPEGVVVNIEYDFASMLSDTINTVNESNNKSVAAKNEKITIKDLYSIAPMLPGSINMLKALSETYQVIVINDNSHQVSTLAKMALLEKYGVSTGLVREDLSFDIKKDVVLASMQTPAYQKYLTDRKVQLEETTPNKWLYMRHFQLETSSHIIGFIDGCTYETSAAKVAGINTIHFAPDTFEKADQFYYERVLSKLPKTHKGSHYAIYKTAYNKAIENQNRAVFLAFAICESNIIMCLEENPLILCKEDIPQSQGKSNFFATNSDPDMTMTKNIMTMIKNLANQFKNGEISLSKLSANLNDYVNKHKPQNGESYIGFDCINDLSEKIIEIRNQDLNIYFENDVNINSSDKDNRDSGLLDLQSVKVDNVKNNNNNNDVLGSMFLDLQKEISDDISDELPETKNEKDDAAIDNKNQAIRKYMDLAIENLNYLIDVAKSNSTLIKASINLFPKSSIRAQMLGVVENWRNDFNTGKISSAQLNMELSSYINRNSEFRRTKNQNDAFDIIKKLSEDLENVINGELAITSEDIKLITQQNASNSDSDSDTNYEYYDFT